MASIIEQLKSKKFRGMLIGMIVVVAIKLGMDPAVANDLIPYVAAIIIAYLCGQGLADFGKAKGQLDLESIMTTAKTMAGELTEAHKKGELDEKEDASDTEAEEPSGPSAEAPKPSQ